MKRDIYNSIYKYIEVLYGCNQKLIKLFGVDAINAFSDGSIDMLSILQDVPRLIPYSYSEKNKQLFLIFRDGLLVYKKDLNNIENEYQSILKRNKRCLIKIKRIRNKCEHILHNVSLKSCYTGNDSWFRYTYKIEKKTIIIESRELISLFKDLNVLYNQLIKEIINNIDADQQKHPFYNYIQRIDLLSFNKLYDSGLLYEIGKSIIGIQT